MADITISQSVRSVVNLIQRPGLIRIGFDDLLAALQTRNGRCLFGFGESDSDNRAHEALTQALKNPLMDRGRMLADATHVLVQVAGGPGMTLSEVEILMQELGRHVNEQTQILFGAAVDGRLGDLLSVTIISSLSADEEADLLQTPSAANNASAVSSSSRTIRAQHRNLKFNLKNPQSKFNLSQKRFHLKNLSRVKRNLPPPISIEPPVIPTRNGEPKHALVRKRRNRSGRTRKKRPFKSLRQVEQELGILNL